MRNIYYIQDIAGPSQLARFQEATPVNSHEISVTALYFALDNFEIPEVATQHPSWSYDMQRAEAITRMERRNGEHIIKGYIPEGDGQAEFETEWIPLQTDQGIQMATKDGEKYITREKLWSNFEAYAKSRGEWTPDLSKERDAQKSMDRALLSGKATSGATYLSHESGHIRYIQIITENKKGGFTSKQYDVRYMSGRDLTPREAEKAIRHVGKLFERNGFQCLDGVCLHATMPFS